MLVPIPARVGDVLTAWPGHPVLTLCVVSPDGRTPLHWCHVPEGRLYGELLHLFLDAKIQALSVASERALLRIA